MDNIPHVLTSKLLCLISFSHDTSGKENKGVLCGKSGIILIIKVILLGRLAESECVFWTLLKVSRKCNMLQICGGKRSTRPSRLQICFNHDQWQDFK